MAVGTLIFWQTGRIAVQGIFAFAHRNIVVQVWSQYWLQPLEQAGLQLFPLPLDCVSCACDSWTFILHSLLPPGLQEGILWAGEALHAALLLFFEALRAHQSSPLYAALLACSNVNASTAICPPLI